MELDSYLIREEPYYLPIRDEIESSKSDEKDALRHLADPGASPLRMPPQHRANARQRAPDWCDHSGQPRGASGHEYATS